MRFCDVMGAWTTLFDSLIHMGSVPLPHFQFVASHELQSFKRLYGQVAPSTRVSYPYLISTL